MNSGGANKKPKMDMDSCEESDNTAEFTNVAGVIQTENFIVHPSLLHKSQNERFTRERYHLLSFFPDDIWYLVLDKMKNPDDLENVSNCSLYWRSLLYSKRQVFLFKNVWQVLGRGYLRAQDHTFKEDGHNSAINSYSEDEGDGSSGEINAIRCTVCKTTKIPRCNSGVLKLRLVCKTWSEAIDEFYQYHPEYFIDLDNGKRLVSSTDHWKYCEFSNNRSRDVHHQQFFWHFDKTHASGSRSPFIAKTIKIRLPGDSPEEAQDFVRKVLSVLSKYGRHVQYCKIEDFEEVSVVKSYNALGQLLEKMPNLTYLKIRSFIFDSDLSSGDLAQVENAINLKPLPKLEHLEFLSAHSLPVQIFNELIRSNSHVTKLRLEWKFDDYERYTTSFSKLRKIHVEMPDGQEKDPLAHPRLGLSLTKLCMRFSQTKHFDLSALFTLIHTVWGDTLTDLAIILPYVEYVAGMDKVPTSLCFRNLKKLQLTTQGNLSMDFLLMMKDTLECLDVIIPWGAARQLHDKEILKKMKQGDMERTIQFFSCTQAPLESNVWSVLSKLKRVRYFEMELNTRNPKKIWDISRWDWKMVRKAQNLHG